MLLCNLTTQCESIAHFYHPIRKSCIILLPNWKVLHNLTTQQETVTTQWESVGYFTTKWKSIVWLVNGNALPCCPTGHLERVAMLPDFLTGMHCHVAWLVNGNALPCYLIYEWECVTWLVDGNMLPCCPTGQWECIARFSHLRAILSLYIETGMHNFGFLFTSLYCCCFSVVFLFVVFLLQEMSLSL